MAPCLHSSGVKILVMGGTRFVGKPLVAQLQAEGHDAHPVHPGQQARARWCGTPLR